MSNPVPVHNPPRFQNTSAGTPNRTATPPPHAQPPPATPPSQAQLAAAKSGVINVPKSRPNGTPKREGVPQPQPQQPTSSVPVAEVQGERNASASVSQRPSVAGLPVGRPASSSNAGSTHHPPASVPVPVAQPNGPHLHKPPPPPPLKRPTQEHLQQVVAKSQTKPRDDTAVKQHLDLAPPTPPPSIPPSEVRSERKVSRSNSHAGSTAAVNATGSTGNATGSTAAVNTSTTPVPSQVESAAPSKAQSTIQAAPSTSSRQQAEAGTTQQAPSVVSTHEAVPSLTDLDASLSFVSVVVKPAPGAPSGEAPKLFRVTLKGDTNTITVEALKHALSDFTGYPIEQQSLSKDGSQIFNHQTGAEFGLKGGTVLYLDLLTHAQAGTLIERTSSAEQQQQPAAQGQGQLSLSQLNQDFGTFQKDVEGFQRLTEQDQATMIESLQTEIEQKMYLLNTLKKARGGYSDPNSSGLVEDYRGSTSPSLRLHSKMPHNQRSAAMTPPMAVEELRFLKESRASANKTSVPPPSHYQQQQRVHKSSMYAQEESGGDSDPYEGLLPPATYEEALNQYQHRSSSHHYNSGYGNRATKAQQQQPMRHTPRGGGNTGGRTMYGGVNMPSHSGDYLVDLDEDIPEDPRLYHHHHGEYVGGSGRKFSTPKRTSPPHRQYAVYQPLRSPFRDP